MEQARQGRSLAYSQLRGGRVRCLLERGRIRNTRRQSTIPLDRAPHNVRDTALSHRCTMIIRRYASGAAMVQNILVSPPWWCVGLSKDPTHCFRRNTAPNCGLPLVFPNVARLAANTPPTYHCSVCSLASPRRFPVSHGTGSLSTVHSFRRYGLG